ncbi:hypothetical protein EUTSA_v10015360mg, partial [Eutrema salsugineum]
SGGWTPLLLHSRPSFYRKVRELTHIDRYESLFGYDPIDKQHKILCMSYNPREKVYSYHLLTFGCEKNPSWTSIECPTRHKPLSSGICINGVLYYAGKKEGASSLVIVCFDVRSEKFSFVDEPYPQSLSSKRVPACLRSFKDKLVSIRWRDLGSRSVKKFGLYLWVLKDCKKPDWSKHVYHLSLPFGVDISVVGIIGTGEIVLSMKYTSNPFYVFYFSPETNTV